MKKFFNSEELNIVQVSATPMAGKTLLQHAVFYDLDDHVKILLDGGYYYHYHYDFFYKSVQKIILPEQVFLPRRIDAMSTGRQQLATGQLDSWVTEKSTPMEMAAIQGKAKALTALEQFTEVKISLICILYFVFLYTFFCIIVFCSMLSCCRYLHFTLPHSPPPRVGWATLPSHSLPIPCK